MPETSSARRGPHRRLAYLLAPLVLAGSIAIGGVAQAASSPAQAAASSPAHSSTSSPTRAASSDPAYFPAGKTAPTGPTWWKPKHRCAEVFGWSSVLFRTGGSIFKSNPRCKQLSIEFVGKTGWYQGYAKSWRTHWKWKPCGRPMFLWKHWGFAILCKNVPPCSWLRVVNLQGKFVPIKVNV